jgi:hypothetical protein
MLASIRKSYLAAIGFIGVLGLGLSPAGRSARGGEEPPALNPFGPVHTEREDAIPGYLEMSDGKVYPGAIYMTRDKRLKIYDEELKRQREIPLRAVKQIECKVLKEWMEKEWRFKELTRNEKYYTGHEYPAQEYTCTITLNDDRTITGPLAEVFYVQPYADPKATGYRPEVEAQRFLLHKRDKGELDTDLKSLTYVRLIKLGEDALEEGRHKAARYRPKRDTSASRAASHRERSR